ncbi:MAG: hypothetical protein HFG18_09515 [Oscillospiraceae bacterium]|nr:hypothetical protein [Oscillospiraceae bacterium]
MENRRNFQMARKLKLGRRNYGRMRRLLDRKAPKTFLELLENGRELDCDLIIGDVDMPASFVWTAGSRISRYGIEKYRPLMDAPIRCLPDGSIELLCDDWQLGEKFCLAAAGYIREAEYQRIFEMEGEKN